MRRIWFQLHKWTGLIIGLQVLAWFVSGLYMTFVPIETVRGEHNIRTIEAPDLRETMVRGYPEKALKALPGRVTRVELVYLDGRPAWRADIEGKPGAIIDDASGDVLSPLGETTARRIAEADFAGNGKIVTATLLEGNPPIEYRGDLPVWQFSFDDADSTNLYVSPVSGKVVARRSSTWRVYDFLWSLHIMDYRDRTDFNNWLVVMSAAVALILTISGMVILVYRFLVPRL
jgi:uncharacterized iron-regulated membrane protein